MSKSTPSEPRPFRPNPATTPLEPTVENTDTTKTAFYSNPKTSTRSTTSPIFSQYQQNVKRQSKEQQTVGTFLKVVAFMLVGGLVLIGGLAGYGGWILSRQIQQQSVSISELESKMMAEIQGLRNSLRDANSIMEDLNANLQSQKTRVGNLEKQIEVIQAQRRKERAADLVRLQKMENRLYDLERTEVRTR